MSDAAPALTSLSNAQIARRIADLEIQLDAGAAMYTSYAPNITGPDTTACKQFVDQLNAAVAREHPAQVQVKIAKFGTLGLITISDDGKHATVPHGDKHYRIPITSLEQYWLDDGHRLPS